MYMDQCFSHIILLHPLITDQGVTERPVQWKVQCSFCVIENQTGTPNMIKTKNLNNCLQIQDDTLGEETTTMSENLDIGTFSTLFSDDD